MGKFQYIIYYQKNIYNKEKRTRGKKKDGGHTRRGKPLAKIKGR
jgi:hypothetical protein